MFRRLFVPGFLIIASAAVAFWLMQSPVSARAAASGADITSPVVKFSHKLHIESVGAECSTCHETATTSTLSSDNLFGGKAVCASCHDVQDAAQCSTCHYENITPAKWQPQVRDLRFPHASHVTGPNAVACGTCHAGIEQSEGEAPTAYPAMQTCVTCHNNRKQSSTCELCHTNFALLVPADHRKSDFSRSHGYETRLGSLTIQCQTCHTEASCQECHQGSGLKSFTKQDLMTDPNPRPATQDGPDQTVLQTVHELNYRFTHGVDAKAKRMDCASCHSTQTFCAECHAAGGNITQPNFRPASHLAAGFALIGKGSGGGLHAQEARRDIESCMSCHDVEGQDPSCLTCHAENGTVR